MIFNSSSKRAKRDLALQELKSEFPFTAHAVIERHEAVSTSRLKAIQAKFSRKGLKSERAEFLSAGEVSLFREAAYYSTNIVNDI